MKISVIGTGYVGAITAAGFAKLGHEVVCVDVDKRKVDLINSKTPPIFEEGLPELLAKQEPLGRAEPVHEEEAVQMIHLVLEDAGEQTFAFDLQGAAVPVDPPQQDAARAPDVLPEVRDGEAALLEEDLPLGLDELGIEHDQELGRIPILGGIGDEETVRTAHLIGGQPQARRRVHRLHHLVDQALEVAIEVGDTPRGCRRIGAP